MDELKKIEEVVQKCCGEGKEYATIGDLVEWCKDTVEALGPMTMIGGGAFGIRFCILIPVLEEMQKELEVVK